MAHIMYGIPQMTASKDVVTKISEGLSSLVADAEKLEIVMASFADAIGSETLPSGKISPVCRAIFDGKIQKVVGAIESTMNILRCCSETLTGNVPQAQPSARSTPGACSTQGVAPGAKSPAVPTAAAAGASVDCDASTTSIPPANSIDGAFGPIDLDAEAEKLMLAATSRWLACSVTSLAPSPNGRITCDDCIGSRLIERIRTLGTLRIIPALHKIICRNVERTGAATTGWMVVGDLLARLFSYHYSPIAPYIFTSDDIDWLFSIYVNPTHANGMYVSLENLITVVGRWGSVMHIRRLSEILSWWRQTTATNLTYQSSSGTRPDCRHPKLVAIDMPNCGWTTAKEVDALVNPMIIQVICFSPPSTFKARLEETMRGVRPKPLDTLENWEWYIHMTELAGITYVRHRVEYYLKMPLVG